MQWFYSPAALADILSFQSSDSFSEFIKTSAELYRPLDAAGDNVANYSVIVNSLYSLPFDVKLLKTNKTTYY